MLQVTRPHSFSPVRFALASIACLALAATPRTAASKPLCPPMPQCSTVPTAIRVAGRQGSEPDTSARFTITVRDLTCNPVANSMVVVDFSACSDLRLCGEQPQGQVLDCASRTVRAFTDANGVATFLILGAARNRGGDPGPGADCVSIYADGVFFGHATAAAWDENGAATANGVEVTDLTSWLKDFGLGLLFGRSDFDGNGRIDVGDLRNLLVVLGRGHSRDGCGAAGLCP